MYAVHWNSRNGIGGGTTFVAAHSKVCVWRATEGTGNLMGNVLALSDILLKMGIAVFKFVQKSTKNFV